MAVFGSPFSGLVNDRKLTDEELVRTIRFTVSYIDEGPTNSPTIIFIHGFPLNKY